MAQNARNNRFTIYDMMDARGTFDANPANVGARSGDGSPLYKGPVEYPRMFYHPKGKLRVVEPARVEPTPVGPVTVPARYEMIWEIAKDEAEAKLLRSKGWHEHPADAIVAGGGKAPPKGADVLLNEKDRRIAELEGQLAALGGVNTLTEPAGPEPGSLEARLASMEEQEEAEASQEEDLVDGELPEGQQAVG